MITAAARAEICTSVRFRGTNASAVAKATVPIISKVWSGCSQLTCPQSEKGELRSSWLWIVRSQVLASPGSIGGETGRGAQAEAKTVAKERILIEVELGRRSAMSRFTLPGGWSPVVVSPSFEVNNPFNPA